MPSLLQFQAPLAVAIGVVLLVLLAERLHERRCRVVAHLATGPSGRPRRWVRWVRPVRALALGAMAWALVMLWLTGAGHRGRESAADRRAQRRHVAFVADLSPSMNLRDAGSGGKLSRIQRMHEVVNGILQRIDGEVLYTVIAFYTDAMPVIVDSDDGELVRNVFNGLPIWFTMKPGKTDLGMGVRKSLEHLGSLPKNSTTLFICTDGDTTDLGTVPKTPLCVREAYVLGVGDQRQGTFIDGHMSRQDTKVLQTLAGRLRAQYIDVNTKHVPTLALGNLALSSGGTKSRYELADIAIYVFATAAAVLAAIPLLLEYFGSDWRTVRIDRRQAAEG